MEYFFLETTLYNVLIVIGFLLLIGMNGFFISRISKVKIKSIQTTMRKSISIAFSIVVVGIVIWLSMNYEIAGTIIIYGTLIIATRILSSLAAGLTDKGIQYEKPATLLLAPLGFSLFLLHKVKS